MPLLKHIIFILLIELSAVGPAFAIRSGFYDSHTGVETFQEICESLGSADYKLNCYGIDRFHLTGISASSPYVSAAVVNDVLRTTNKGFLILWMRDIECKHRPVSYDMKCISRLQGKVRSMRGFLKRLGFKRILVITESRCSRLGFYVLKDLYY